MRNLIVNTDFSSECSLEERIERLAEIGWNGVFVGYHGDDLVPTARRVRECGLILQSVHAPFHHVDRLWEEREEGEKELLCQLACLENSASAGVTLVVEHAIIGMERNTPTQLGVDRFGTLVQRARELGIRLAIENTEGEIYLETLLNAFRGEKHVGFCIDTGHEMCYNRRQDLIGKYSGRVFCTHLNDNMGQTGETLTWFDDSHMLPFDGTADWQGIADRLARAGYTGDLTFEFVKGNRPERTTNDRYERLSFREYAALALEKARQFAAIVG